MAEKRQKKQAAKAFEKEKFSKDKEVTGAKHTENRQDNTFPTENHFHANEKPVSNLPRDANHGSHRRNATSGHSVQKSEAEAEKAKNATEALFGSGNNLDNVPTITVRKDEWGCRLLDLLAENKVIATKSEGRRLMQQNGLSIDDAKVTDVDTLVDDALFADKESLMLRKGKKKYYRLVRG